MKSFQNSILLIFLLVGLYTDLHSQVEVCAIGSNLGDVTHRITILGNVPENSGMTGKARNIWDLQLFGEDIFIGFGNTTTNPGPIDLISYNLQTSSLKFNGVIKNEAIEKFRVHGSDLYIPASDPTSGNLLKYNISQQSDYQSVSFNPKLAHVRDIAIFENQRFLLGNTLCPGLKTTECNGLVIEDITTGSIQTGLLSPLLDQVGDLENSRWNWFFGYLIWNEALILPNAMYTEAYNSNLAIEDNLFFSYKNGSIKWSAFESEATRLKHEHFYPVNTNPTQFDPVGTKITLRPVSQIEFQGKLLYTLRSYSIFEEHYLKEYNNSRGFILKENLYDEASFVSLPASDAIGEDLLVIEEEVYVLSNKRISADEHLVYIYKSSNPDISSDSWEEVLFFESSNMARSFEYDGSHFYIGLGINEGDSLAQAGNLLKISACNPTLCPPFGNPCDDLNPCTIADQQNGFCECIGIFNDLNSNDICDIYEACNHEDLILPSLPAGFIYSAGNAINIETYIQPYSDIMISSVESLTLLPKFEVSLFSELDLQIKSCIQTSKF